MLADVTVADTVTALTQALRLRPDSEIMAWMQWPYLWIEFIDAQGLPIAMVGLLRPDWVHWEHYGDIQLSEPALVEDLLSSFGLNDFAG